ncbi:MAG TPA: ATP-binding protein [Bryobacteraceae bacterium]|jgi:PAS domain S-box-containing protein|nr:ATP-binding protein [Bryobacteraceae bacterium]
MLQPQPLFALILEDQEADFDLVARELRRAGFIARCHRVETEKEYLAKLEERPDIILADYALPSFSALHALELVEKLQVDIPFIVLTGFVSEDVVVECMKRGAADYLLKDRLVRLGPAVKRALKESELRQQRRDMEAALRKSNERFLHLVETTRVIPWEFDLDASRVTYVGPQVVSLLGYQLEDWYKKEFWDSAVYHDDTQVLTTLPQNIEPSPKDHEFSFRMLAKDGRILDLNCVVTLTIENNTKMLRGFMTDVTDLRRMQRSLAQQAAIQEENRRIVEELKTKEIETLRAHAGREAAEVRAAMAEQLFRANEGLHAANRKLKDTQAQLIQTEKMASLGQLVAGIAHEINNPMAFVINNLFIVEDRLNHVVPEIESLLSEASRVNLRKIRIRLGEMKEGLNRVKELVLSLRTFSRLDEEMFKAVDIGKSIDSVLLFLNHRMEGRIELEKLYGPERMLYCSGGKLNQVCMNVICNAIEAIPGNGKITISTGQNDDVFTISVRDTGAGIPDAIRNRIFDPFFTTKRVGEGTGLGLAISYGIIQEHQGSIEVRSDEGVGSEFIIKVPRDLKSRRESDRRAIA